jgi:hypothetical protein
MTKKKPKQPRDYSKERKYLKKSQDDRVKRNKARREAIRDGRASVGDGKDVHHKKPLSKGGSNKKANTKVVSRSSNRSFKRTSKGKIA